MTGGKYTYMPFLFGLASSGVYHAKTVTNFAVRSYRTLSPFPCEQGSLLSVALSVGSRHPDVIRHCIFVKPRLSSQYSPRDYPTFWHGRSITIMW